MFERAKKWVLEQRISELKKSIRHWPDSKNLHIRELELSRLEDELEEINEKLSPP